MLVLASGDSLRGVASVAAVVDYSFHGLAGSTISLLAEGQLPSADGALYTAAAVVVVKSIVIVNTHTLAVTINLTILKSGSTARRLLPKDLSLPAGYMAIFDGTRFSVYDASGNLLTLIANVTGLSGLLADDQHVLDAEVLAVAYDKTLISAAGAALIDDADAAAQRATLGAAPVVAVGVFSAYPSVLQLDIPYNIDVKVQFDSEEYDVNGWFDTTSDKYVPLLAGYYRFDCAVYLYPGVDASIVDLYLFKNGVALHQLTRQHCGSAIPVCVSGSVIAYANGSTDYFEVYIYHTFGVSTSDINVGPVTTYFQGEYIGK